MTAKVKDGRLLKVAGSDLRFYNGASLCARGLAAPQLVNDPDRLKYPMKRVGPRGDGKWVRISWGEAIDTISLHLEKALHRMGPQALALFAKGPSSRYIKELFHEFSVPHINDISFEQCDLNREIAFRLTFGNDAAQPAVPDYDNTRCVVLFGNHMGENVNVGELKRLLAAKGRGVRLIVVDPRFSSIADKADDHLMIRPGTDSALILGWLNHILDSGLYDVGFVAEHVAGFAELRRAASAFPLDRVEAITSIPADIVRRTARAIAEAAPAVIIHPGSHATWYGNDVERLRCQAVLAGILGTWGAAGGLGPQRSTQESQNPVADNQEAVKRLLQGRDSHGAAIFKNIRKGVIKVVGCWGQNPIQSQGNPYHVLAAFKEAEFIFACDVLPSDTTLYADIILPEASFLERFDVVEQYAEGGERFVAARFPAVPPGFEAKDPYWIVKQLSNRLGRGARFHYADAAARLDSELAAHGLNLKKLQEAGGVAQLPGKAQPTAGYATSSGKIECAPELLGELGLGKSPGFAPIPLPPAGFARLLYGRSPVHTMTSTMNNSWLRAEMAENVLWINEELAGNLNVHEGERLMLENQDGVRSMKPVAVHLTPGIRPDCVYLVHGFGVRSHLLRQGFDQGVSDALLMTRNRPDPLSGSHGLRVNYVRLLRDGKPLNLS